MSEHVNVLHKPPISHCLRDKESCTTDYVRFEESATRLSGRHLGGLGCVPIEINGMEEHVHLLVRLRPTIAVSDFLSKLKSLSSLWAKRQTKGRFAWQAKYGAFTVSESQVGKVRKYIREQEKHHRAMSFEEEFEALLKGNRIDFDEKYLWT